VVPQSIWAKVRSSIGGHNPTPRRVVSPTHDDRAQVRAAYCAMYRSMLERNTDILNGLLDDDYTLSHLTGYLQSKKEWLEQIDSGEMQYHSLQERGSR
jgi:hypothetical protein